MKLYIVTAEVSYIRCDGPRDEAERKGTHIQGGDLCPKCQKVRDDEERMAWGF